MQVFYDGRIWDVRGYSPNTNRDLELESAGTRILATTEAVFGPGGVTGNVLRQLLTFPPVDYDWHDPRQWRVNPPTQGVPTLTTGTTVSGRVPYVTFNNAPIRAVRRPIWETETTDAPWVLTTSAGWDTVSAGNRRAEVADEDRAQNQAQDPSPRGSQEQGLWDRLTRTTSSFWRSRTGSNEATRSLQPELLGVLHDAANNAEEPKYIAEEVEFE